ncbi:MAG: hypothetical protein ABIB71_02825 [Candidatus Woesearchaeota archaeon]
MKKKGAIELSMTTIIVVVIGITLLILGIKFVYDTMGDVSGLSRTVFEGTQSEIQSLFGKSEDPINVNPTSMQLEQGNAGEIKVYIRNGGQTGGAFSYTLQVTDLPDEEDKAYAEDWFIADESPADLESGQIFEDVVAVDIPDDATIGTYKLRLTLSCAVKNCGDSKTKSVIVRVQ